MKYVKNKKQLVITAACVVLAALLAARFVATNDQKLSNASETNNAQNSITNSPVAEQQDTTQKTNAVPLVSVVYSETEKKTYALDKKTGSKVLLTGAADSIRSAVVSPDGKWGVFAIDGAGGELRTGIVSLTDGTATDLYATASNFSLLRRRVSWASDSSAFVTGCDVGGGLVGACLTSVRSGTPKMFKLGGITNSLSNGSKENVQSATISPDGKTATWVEWRKDPRELRFRFATVSDDGNVTYSVSNQYLQPLESLSFADTLTYTSDGKKLKFPLVPKDINRDTMYTLDLDLTTMTMSQSDVTTSPTGTYKELDILSSPKNSHTLYPIVRRANYLIEDFYVTDTNYNFKKVQLPDDPNDRLYFEPYWLPGERLIFAVFDVSTETSDGVIEYEVDLSTGGLKEVCEVQCESKKL
jgi:hypothetical protein